MMTRVPRYRTSLLLVVMIGFLLCAQAGHAAPRAQGAGQAADAATRELTVEIAQLPELAFRLETPVGLSWTKDGSVMKGLEESGLVADFTRLMIGQGAQQPDRLRITIYVADVAPTRAALLMDYARLMAKGFGNGEDEEEAIEDDAGNVISANVTTVVSRDEHLKPAAPSRSLISVWRRGLKLLVVRADMGPTEADVRMPQLRQMMRSMTFLSPMASDPLMAGMVEHTVRLPSGKDMHFLLPPNWQSIGAFDEQGAFASQMFQDQASIGRPPYVSVFGMQVEPGAPMTPALLRDGADRVSTLLLDRTRRNNGYTHRQRVSATHVIGFENVAGLDALFVDDVSSDNPLEPDLATQSHLVALHGKPETVIGYSLVVRTKTSDWREIGAMMHANFVQRLLVDSMMEEAPKLGKP